MGNVFLGLGSNLGDRQHNLTRALDLLEKHGAQTRRVSPIYETEPMDVKDQPKFLNLVYNCWFNGSPRELLNVCHQVEQEMGRERTQEKGPRNIDIDILVDDHLLVDEPDLKIPHPAMAERRFVLVPLSMLEPSLELPRWENKTVEQLLKDAPPEEVVPWHPAHQ